MAKPQKFSQFAQWRAARKQQWEQSWFAKSRLGKWLRVLLGSKNKPAQPSPATAPNPESTSAAVPAASYASVTSATQNDMMANKKVKNGTVPQTTETAPSPEQTPAPTPTPASTHIKNLSKDTAMAISDWLPLADAARLAQVDRFFFQNTQERVNERAAHILVEHIALGRLSDAERMVKANPKLLYLKAKVKDYAGHEIVGADRTGATAYECALGAGFLKAAEMLAGHFTDEGERLRQHKRQLPNGWVYEGETLFTEDYADALIEEILKSSDDDVSAALEHIRNQEPLANQTSLREALDAFREKLTPRPQVKAGKHINHQNLLNGLSRYAATWQDQRWTLEKYRLYYWQVLGFMEREESAGVAMYLAKGLMNITVEAVAPSNFDFTDHGGRYFPLPKDDVGLGFDCWVDFYYGSVCGYSMSGWPTGRRVAILKNFLEPLHRRLENLADPLNPQKTHGV